MYDASFLSLFRFHVGHVAVAAGPGEKTLSQSIVHRSQIVG